MGSSLENMFPKGTIFNKTFIYMLLVVFNKPPIEFCSAYGKFYMDFPIVENIAAAAEPQSELQLI